MKIGIIGASGKAGNLILEEAVKRGNDVTAIVRTASKITNDKVAVIEKDLFDLTVDDIKDFDVVVNAFNAPHGKEELHVTAGKHLIDIFAQAPAVRLIVVGGAGSLYVDEAKTTQLFKTPDFPEAYLPTATNMGKNLEDLQAATGLTWTYISPAAFFDFEGARTGEYRLGGDVLLTNDKGDSYISYADFAVALVDEAEKGAHKNERISVATK